ncbi:hypothetical protein ACIPSA_36385 [Streptomyces sp. NPDC086549]|uniref:hypothetical protein n=1 Tax=Streptomyces sp. NPDC086549 TaxID=3365752 RepID=UPI00382287EC
MREAFASPAARAEAEADFLEVRRLGADAYPTLLHTAHGTDRLGRRAHPCPGPARGHHHGRLKPPLSTL